MDMVELVARAAYENYHDEGEQWDDMGPNHNGRRVWKSVARAAIQAMRQPTREMTARGRDEMRRQNPPDAAMIARPWSGKVWQAMIDAALNNGTPTLDPIDFLKMEGMTFPEAIEHLTNKAKY